MARSKSYFYILDNLTRESAERIKASLMALVPVEGVRITLNHGLIEVISNQDVELQIRMACDMNKVTLRTKVKKREIQSF